ncbi:hypothetical protein SDC9_129449 [bioreactor metagenome]|uniref:Uncharacterized protein n=1 Tax=bioreactor metagenome TaxID=1076179 RepID=A0A645CZV3_9ZZZZ
MLQGLQLLMFDKQALLQGLDLFAVILQDCLKRRNLLRLKLCLDMLDHAGLHCSHAHHAAHHAAAHVAAFHHAHFPIHHASRLCGICGSAKHGSSQKNGKNNF